MDIIKLKLASWLSHEIENTEFRNFICSYQSSVEERFSRGVFLKLKQCNRAVGRIAIESIEPCYFCSVTSLSEVLSFRENPFFQYISCPDDIIVEFDERRDTGTESYWQCKKCGSITQLVLPEREFRGCWAKVG